MPFKTLTAEQLSKVTQEHKPGPSSSERAVSRQRAF